MAFNLSQLARMLRLWISRRRRNTFLGHRLRLRLLVDRGAGGLVFVHPIGKPSGSYVRRRVVA